MLSETLSVLVLPRGEKLVLGTAEACWEREDELTIVLHLGIAEVIPLFQNISKSSYVSDYSATNAIYFPVYALSLVSVAWAGNVPKQLLKRTFYFKARRNDFACKKIK